MNFKRPSIDQFIQFGKRLRVTLVGVAHDLRVVTRLRNVHTVRVSGPAAFPQRRNRLLRRLPGRIFDWVMDRAGPKALTSEF